MLNIFFSNNVLLRVAYIPPNVIIDPILRATMDTESLFMTRNLFPGWQTNLQQHAARRKRGVPRRTYRSAKEAKKDLQSRVDDQTKLQNSVAGAESVWRTGAKRANVTKAEEAIKIVRGWFC